MIICDSRQSYHNSSSVSISRVGSGRSTMDHVAEEGFGVAHDLVGGDGLDVDDEADSTGVRLVEGVVETLRGGETVRRLVPEDIGGVH